MLSVSVSKEQVVANVNQTGSTEIRRTAFIYKI